MGLLSRRHPTTTSPPEGGAVGITGIRAQDFAAVYDTYFPAVYGYCLSRLGDPEAAEDAASQTFLKALSALSTYRESGRFRPWLFAIAHNVLLDIHRTHRSADSLDTASQILDPAHSPEERALAALDADWLDCAIARLPPDDRQVLELRRAGLNGREIAAVLGIGHEAAKKRQLRAMDRIRSELTFHINAQEDRHEA